MKMLGKAWVVVAAAKLLLLVGCMLFIVGCATLLQGTSGEPTITLETIQGRVLVIRGNEYVVAQKDLALLPGDQVATLSDSAATVRYGLVDERGEAVGKPCMAKIGADAELIIASLEDCQGKPRELRATDADVVATTQQSAEKSDADNLDSETASDATSSRSLSEVIAGWFQTDAASNNSAKVTTAEPVTTQPRVVSKPSNNQRPSTQQRGLPIVKLKPSADGSGVPTPSAAVTSDLVPKIIIAESVPSRAQTTPIVKQQSSQPLPLANTQIASTASNPTATTRANNSPANDSDDAPPTIYYAVFAPNLGKTPAVLAAGKQAAVAFFLAPAVDTGVGQTGIRVSVISDTALTDPQGEQPLLVRLDCAICSNLDQTQAVMNYTPAKGRSSRAVFKFTPTRIANGTGLLQFQVTGSSGKPQTVAVQVKVQ